MLKAEAVVLAVTRLLVQEAFLVAVGAQMVVPQAVLLTSAAAAELVPLMLPALPVLAVRVLWR